MSSQNVPEGLPINEADWKQTPLSVRVFILWQQELIAKLTKRVEELEVKLGQNSKNSNRPPSTDPPYQREKRESKGTGKPGANQGHKGHRQSLLTPTESVPVPPNPCNCGGQEFEDLRPFYTHQHIELPEIPIKVTHFILQEGACTVCGKTCRGKVPEGFQAGFGERLIALVGELSGSQRCSQVGSARFFVPTSQIAPQDIDTARGGRSLVERECGASGWSNLMWRNLEFNVSLSAEWVWQTIAAPGHLEGHFSSQWWHAGAGVFDQPESRDMLREVVQEVRQRHPFTIDAWVLLPEHMHCIWTLPRESSDFSMRWSLIKSGFSRRAKFMYHVDEWMNDSKHKHRETTIWQRRFWEHQIRSEEEYQVYMDYTHFNPVKHGLVKSVVDWPYSTFHRYVRLGIYLENWGGGMHKVAERGFGE